MTYDNLVDAIIEAERFLLRAMQARKVCEFDANRKEYNFPNPSPDVAACKRASLDLTMALAKLRRE